MKYFMLLIICLVFLSCEEEPDYHPIPQILKEWGYFEKGSYWIYQNDSTLLTDSIFISSLRFKNDSMISDKKLRDIYETIIIDYKSAINSINYTSQLHGAIYSNLFFNYINNTTIKHADCVLLRIDPYASIIDSSSYYYISNKYSEFALNNIIYNEVLVINAPTRYYFTDSTLNSVFFNQYWISKGNWIIKRVIHTDKGVESWSLIRKKII